MNDNLPSLDKLQNDIKAAKCISWLLPPKKRQELNNIDMKLKYMRKTIDSFNDYFSDLGWCAYDSINTNLMESANKAFEKDGAYAGEQVLIEYYKNDVKNIVHWLKAKAKPFMERDELIQKAFDDHFSGRYYASVPLFLIIIDGAVNDFTKSKGFFAEGTDVSAWDCLVGCSEGLAKLKIIFNKGRNKTTNEEIQLPYRNGILHGRDLNYGNAYVSCKCVALMFALADWMNMKDNEEKRKEKYEKENNPPPLSESIRRIRQNATDREEIHNWSKREIIVGRDIPYNPSLEDCADYQYVIPIIKVFNEWTKKNYGELSKLLKSIFYYEKSIKKRAGECRKLFSKKEFISFELKEIEERGCSLSRILVQANWKVGDNVFSEPLEFGCEYQDEDERTALPWRGNGQWILIPWNIQGLYKF
jgi:hypothetical protein